MLTFAAIGGVLTHHLWRHLEHDLEDGWILIASAPGTDRLACGRRSDESGRDEQVVTCTTRVPVVLPPSQVDVADQVTRSTFFRHFSDKREVLVAGQETLSRLLRQGIDEAPADASPLEVVAPGLERASSEMEPLNRELGPRLKAAVAASVELQERDALKSMGLAAAMTDALLARGVDEPIAHLASELGVLAFKLGFAKWIDADRHGNDDLAPYTLAAPAELQTATESLSAPARPPHRAPTHT
jgi:AcrR family transcriptional regulator